MANDHDAEKKEIIAEYEKNVEWLSRHVPRDDVYDFAEQCLMASEFLMYELGHFIDISDEITRETLLGKWCKNIVGIRVGQKNDFKGILNIGLEFGELP